MEPDTDVLPWLLETDPALRWRVERDLAGASASTWQRTRARVGVEGFGAALLARQDPDGQWAGGAFFPADFTAEEGERDGQPWTATTWALNDLREWGADPALLGDTAERLRAHSRWEYDDLPYWDGEVDACINAYTLANGAWLGTDVDALHDWFPAHRLADGGWNCEWVEGSTRSSVWSTLNVVRGLLAYQEITGDTSLAQDRRAGEEYLLERSLLRTLTTGVEFDALRPRELVHPFRGRYGVLPALDHFVEVTRIEGTPPDPRLAEAIGIVRDAQGADGRWRQAGRHGGRAWFEVDAAPGEPSPWITYTALRALRWWDLYREATASDRGGQAGES